MSKATVIRARTSVGFKQNTQRVIKQLYAAGVRDSVNMSEYVLEAVKEKRERDERRLIEGSGNV